MRTHGLLAPTLIVLATVAGCSAPPGAEEEDIAGSGQYSVTQTITNNSATDLTVEEIQVYNGGSVLPGAPTTIPANSPKVAFTTSSTNDGVSMRIFLVGEGGQSMLVDSDVPRVDRNWTSANLAGTQTGLSTGKMSISGGDNPTADFTIDPCGQGPCTTTSGASSPLLKTPRP